MLISKGGYYGQKIFFDENPLIKPAILVPKEKKLEELNKELQSLRKLLGGLEFELMDSKYDWPRDLFTCHNGVILPGLDFGCLGTGGHMVYGNGFVLISKRASEEKDPYKPDFLVEHTDWMFPGLEWYVVEEMADPSLKPYFKNGHIDLIIGSVPSRNLLTVDSRHYEQEEEMYDEISRKHGTTVIPVRARNSETRIKFGNNYLVVEDGLAEPLAVVNKGSPEVVSELKNMGVYVKSPEVDIVSHPKNFKGGIRCMTNVVYSRMIMPHLEPPYMLARL